MPGIESVDGDHDGDPVVLAARVMRLRDDLAPSTSGPVELVTDGRAALHAPQVPDAA